MNEYLQTKEEKRAYQREYQSKRRAEARAKNDADKLIRRPKTCASCGETSIADSDNYARDYYTDDKFKDICRDCGKIEQAERTKEQNLIRSYGLTLESWNQMFEHQGGKCSICGTHQSELNHVLCVDHDHETGKVRDLLCARCNGIVGSLESEVADLAMAYIKLHK